MAPEQSSEDDRSDRDLLAAHVAGDHDAFGELFARHRDRLWAVALRTAGDREVAADALQDAMVSAFRRAGTFRGDAAVTTWLHRVVVNACLDRHRSAATRRAEPLPDDLDRDGDGGPSGRLVAAAGEPVDPAERAVAADRRSRVLAGLAQLSPDHRAALVLVDMEGYPVAEAAQMLDCAVGTLKSRCHRGRARLAQLLGDLLETSDHDAADAQSSTAVAARNPGTGADVPTTGAPRSPPPRR